MVDKSVGVDGPATIYGTEPAYYTFDGSVGPQWVKLSDDSGDSWTINMKVSDGTPMANCVPVAGGKGAACNPHGADNWVGPNPHVGVPPIEFGNQG